MSPPSRRRLQFYEIDFVEQRPIMKETRMQIAILLAFFFFFLNIYLCPLAVLQLA